VAVLAATQAPGLGAPGSDWRLSGPYRAVLCMRGTRTRFFMVVSECCGPGYIKGVEVSHCMHVASGRKVRVAASLSTAAVMSHAGASAAGKAVKSTSLSRSVRAWR
jgi:hypothetical protein